MSDHAAGHTDASWPGPPARDPFPLRGRVALVTGASRRGGIGYATARRLAAYGASVMVHHHRPHDAELPWGSDDPARLVAWLTTDEASWVTGQVISADGGFSS